MWLCLPTLAALVTLPCAHCDEPAEVSACDLIRALDPDQGSTTGGVHYLVSNERRLDLFSAHARSGDASTGVHVGVGTDPNYFIAAWARSSSVIVVDFDQQVVDLHGLYVLFLQASETAEQFAAMWSEQGSEHARALVALRFFEPRTRVRMTVLYDAVRADVARRMTVMGVKMDELGERSWLDDPDQYSHLRELARRGAIVAVRGDFVAQGVVAEIGEALRDLDLEIQTLYLSNIEQYFMYGQTWRDNVAALPLDEDSVVFRTLPARPAGFQYIVQTGESFLDWVGSPKVRSVYRIRGWERGDESLVAGELFVVTEEAP